MVNTRIMTTITFLMAVVLSLFTTSFANPTEPDTGMIICEPALSPYLCQLRLTMWDTEVWEVNEQWYNVLMHVYDPWCRQISGNVWANLGQHVSVNSELPWTVEIQVPNSAFLLNYVVIVDPGYAVYAGRRLMISTNFATYYPSEGKSWGGMTSSLFGFEC